LTGEAVEVVLQSFGREAMEIAVLQSFWLERLKGALRSL
jgi:hypothetical protein